MHTEIIFLGDVMLGRMVNETIDQVDPSYVWGNTLAIIKGADLRIINQEFAITDSPTPVEKTFNFRMSPAHLKALTVADIDYVNLANNHILDYDDVGMEDTLNTLKTTNIVYGGAGMNKQEACSPHILDVNDLKIGIISCSDHYDNWAVTDAKPGIQWMTIDNEGLKVIEQHIHTLQGQVDYIVLCLHWGPNMRQVPPQHFQDFARACVDLGIDIFHGHSAHVFQGMEIYKGRPIFYDTGDFIDDYRIDDTLRNDQGFIFQVTLNDQAIQAITLTPTLTTQCQINLTPNPTDQLSKMQQLSKQLGCILTVKDNKLHTNLQ